MNIRGIEVKDLNLFDEHDMLTYEKAMEFIEENKNTDTRDKKPSEVIREQCLVVREFINILFGEDTDKRLFGDKNDLYEMLEICAEIITECESQMGKIEYMKNNLFDKHNPNLKGQKNIWTTDFERGKRHEHSNRRPSKKRKYR